MVKENIKLVSINFYVTSNNVKFYNKELAIKCERVLDILSDVKEGENPLKFVLETVFTYKPKQTDWWKTPDTTIYSKKQKVAAYNWVKDLKTLLQTDLQVRNNLLSAANYLFDNNILNVIYNHSK